MKRSNVILAVGIVCAMCAIAIAAVPGQISLQGILWDAGGNPVADASYSVVFKIYDASSGGNVLWTETQSVSTTGGVYTVLLGSTTPIPESTFNSISRWLGMKVGGDPEMSPRQQLVSTGYSFVSSQWTSAAQNLFRLNGNVGIGTTTPAEKLQVDGTVRMMGFKLTTSPTPGYVLTSDASGVGTWQAAGGGGTFVSLQASTPGSQQSGNLNISGTGLFGSKVGIGTTSPSKLLTIQTSGADYDISTSGSAGLDITTQGGGVGGAITISSRENSSAGLVITTDNNVAIGLTNPDFKFYVGSSSGQVARIGNMDYGTGLVFSVAPGDVNFDGVGAPGGRLKILGSNGYVGIGYSAPAYPLHLGNGAHCTAGGVWTNSSSRNYKTDIRPLRNTEYSDILEKLEQVSVVRFKYKKEPNREHIGLIAEDVPEEIASEDRTGVPTADAIAFLMAALKAQQTEIKELKEIITELRQRR